MIVAVGVYNWQYGKGTDLAEVVIEHQDGHGHTETLHQEWQITTQGFLQWMSYSRLPVVDTNLLTAKGRRAYYMNREEVVATEQREDCPLRR